MTAAIREQIATALALTLPKRNYQIVSNVGTVDRLGKALVQIEVSAFEPSEKAKGLRATTVTVHTATRHQGTTKQAEDDADEIAHEVFEALEALTWINPTRAEKVIYGGQHLGYDITAEVITQRS